MLPKEAINFLNITRQLELKLAALKEIIGLGGLPDSAFIFDINLDIHTIYKEYLELVTIYAPEELGKAQKAIGKIKEYLHKQYDDAWKTALTQKDAGHLLVVLSFFYTEIFAPVIAKLLTIKADIQRSTTETFVKETIPRFGLLEKYLEKTAKVIT